MLDNEFNGHISNEDWELIPCSEVPEGVEPIPSVWDVWRKRDRVANQVTKYKAI